MRLSRPSPPRPTELVGLRPGEVVLRGATRSFEIRADPARTLKGLLLGRRPGGPAAVPALQGVTLAISPGETVGMVGRNGAGKTSTLRVLAGIVPLHAGEAGCGGRVVSLLELAAGFSRDFSGRENVYLYRRLFARWGWSGQDYAPVTAAGLAPGTIASLHQLRPGYADRVVIHYSGYAAGLEDLAARCPRTLVISHNITPPRYFWTHDPAEAVRCQLAVDQLARLAAVAGGLAGVSDYNAGQLRELSGRETVVIPVLFDRGALAPAADVNGAAPPADHDGVTPAADHDGPAPPVVLFVGRLVPHKRQDLVIRAFARWRHATPDARLVLVGTPLSAEFAASLRRLADELAPGAVSFQSALSPAELGHRYRDAGAFVCLSEHEGFCIPLLEAFHFGLPVIARDPGVVGEVVADAGVLLSDADGVAVVGELLSLVMSDAELRGELARRGAERLTAYEFSRTAELVRAAVEEVAAA